MLTVGVVIPVYRCAPYVRGCLDSVLAQTRPVRQIVLVDDCGGDDSIDIARELLDERGEPYTLITQVRNGGLGRARNAGLAALETDLVWFLDSDDQAEPEFVAEVAGALENVAADFAVTRTQRVDAAGNVLQIDEAEPPTAVVPGDVYARDLLRGRAKAYACTKIFRREILGDRPWPEGQAYEDIATAVRLALAAPRVALVADPLYRYLYREGSLSTALSERTLDLFLVEQEVRALVAGTGWQQDFLGFRYREVLTSVAHVAIRARHAAAARPPLYDPAIRRVRAEIDLAEVPALLTGRHYRAAIFAVLVKFLPWFYAGVLRWR